MGSTRGAARGRGVQAAVFAGLIALALAGPALIDPARAQEACPGNPDALGTARVIKVDPAAQPYLGTMQYKQTLPLNRGEVVLTFDDGPLPPMSLRVLDALAKECVKATFFIVGRMASAYPSVLQRAANEGHTIGTHSQTHPLIFPKLNQQAGVGEIEKGFTSTNAALAPIGAKAAPFFRFPGLGRTKPFEQYTKSRGLAVFSVDLTADDWLHLKPDEVMKRALQGLEARGSGILLLHDIQPATAVMLPTLLRELKARQFKVVHVVFARGAHASAGDPSSSAASAAGATQAKTSLTSAAGFAAPTGATAAAFAQPAALGGSGGPAETPFPGLWPRLPVAASTGR